LKDEISLAILEEQVKKINEEVVLIRKHMYKENSRDLYLESRMTRAEEAICSIKKITYLILASTLTQVIALVYQFME